MYMTPNEAEEIMKPFYPHDPSLAIQAIRRALGGDIPDWICESIVGSYFLFLQLKDLEEKAEQLMKNDIDPFGLNTIPYRYKMGQSELMNEN